MGSVREDIMFIQEVIGAGEIAISDLRGLDPTPHDLARVATDCYVGGMLSSKAGVLHLHVGEGDSRLQPLRDTLNSFNVEPGWFYPTHVERTEKLMREAIDLAKKGVPIDVDTVEEDFPKWLRFYRDHGGPPEMLTISTDASITSPRLMWEQIRSCILEHGFPPEDVLRLVTRNTSRILKLDKKGVIEKGRMGDLLILEKDTFEIVHVLSNGVFMVRDGNLVRDENFLADSNREIHLRGRKGEEEEA
jgi:beta-aspartyl-dipeptidase (metallo-type)